MSAIGRIVKALPGPVVVYAQSWTSLFASSHLANPEWRIPAENTGVVLGAFVAVVLSLVFGTRPLPSLKIYAIGLFVVTLILFAFCLVIYFLLGPPAPGERTLDATWWNEIWKVVYSAAILSLISTISVAVLSQDEGKRPWLIPVLVVGSIFLLVVAIALYFLILR
jgi:hypothetical protein